MSDCTGYGINQQIYLSTDGGVGNGATANLTIRIENGVSPFYVDNFDTSKTVVVNNWDGSDITVDVTSLLIEDGYYSFVGASCDLEARLTIMSRGDNRYGTMLLEFIFTNCVSDFGTYGVAQVFDNCGGAGPHVVSQMQNFYLEDTPVVT